jgi:hypothetical protein
MKIIIKLACILLTLFVFTGCASQAQLRSNAMQQAFDDALTKNRACRDSMKLNTSVIFAFNNFLIENDNSQNKYTLLSSNQKLNKDMQQHFINFLNENSKCRGLAIENASKVHAALVIPIVERQRRNDNLGARLLSSEITIGEFNRGLQDSASQYDRDFRLAQSEIDRELQNSHNYEMQSRQRAALIMQNWSIQQQQLYQNQMLYNNLNRPVTTNCSVIGNFVNCTTN